jgi:hypothetical protein
MDAGERQALLDEEHLRLLRIGYLVFGGINAFAALMILTYAMFFGTMFRYLPIPVKQGEVDPRVLLSAMMGIVAFMGVLVGGIAVLKFLTARALGRRRGRTLCQVCAALTCLSVPLGTLLGIFTFMVLSRPTVMAMFDAPGEGTRPTP